MTWFGLLRGLSGRPDADVREREHLFHVFSHLQSHFPCNAARPGQRPSANQFLLLRSRALAVGFVLNCFFLIWEVWVVTNTIGLVLFARMDQLFDQLFLAVIFLFQIIFRKPFVLVSHTIDFLTNYSFDRFHFTNISSTSKI